MKLLVLLLLPCLSLSELVKDFGFCRDFFMNKDPPRFTPQWGNSVKRICQCVWDNNDQQKFLYATLYNTDWKIPIYSAYVFKESTSVGRCDVWYIEPQLDDANGDPCMAPKGRKTINNQAVNRDYEGQGSKKPSYDKGHLYPVQHTYDHISMLATSTLTNIKLKKVTVSKYYWRATCCLKNGVFTGKAYFGPDNNNVVNDKLSITALQKQLTTDYKVNIVIFPSGYPPGGCI